MDNFPPPRLLPPHGGPENLRFHPVSKCFLTSLVVVNQPSHGSQDGQ